MINIVNKCECSGCSACYSICPQNAISFKEDFEGFLYPIVDMEKCVNCGLCEKVCPYLNNNRPINDIKKTYVGINKNSSIRTISSSGGMFAVFAEKILQQGGVVFGAAYDKNWMVYHQGIERDDDIFKLIGSKYLQSRMEDTFSEVKKILNLGRKVLFVGTTCQVNGLRNYLVKEYDNLYLVDFICLGVPSPKVWKDYLETFFNKDEIEFINFKNKALGWHRFSLNIKSKYSEFCEDGRDTFYFTGYFRHLYSRPSCANCVSKIGNRVSDITISDCWGYDMIAPEMDDNKGMSSIICHSEKGLDLFKQCQNNIVWKHGDFQDVLLYNPGYSESKLVSEERDLFWRDYDRLDKKELFIKYCSPAKNGLLQRAKRKIRKILERVLH